MSNILLAKPKLSSDWIDVSVGEPHIVRDKLQNMFHLRPIDAVVKPHDYEYPDSAGYEPLVKFLTEKHKAPVIITNGAKQALGACFYALKRMNWNYCDMKSPYWALIPPLAAMHGIETTTNGGPDVGDRAPFLLLTPNNPDGHTESATELRDISDAYKHHNIPLIHDAAYYTRTYLPEMTEFPVVGDVQIYSISKMLGLSGLRIGYAVIHDLDMYQHILHYMEAMTVGVSNISQIFLFDLFQRMQDKEELTRAFENTSAAALKESKRIIKKVDSDILEVDPNIENIPGMFGWFKVGPKADFVKSKINVIDGALFGVPGMIRMNLAFSSNVMEQIVDRLNSVK